jgi:hypothetical protein
MKPSQVISSSGSKVGVVEGGERRDDLVGRAGEVVLLDGAVDEGLERALRPRGVLLAADRLLPAVGVDRGDREHGEDLAGARVHRDERAGGLVGEGLGGDLLEVEVEGEVDVLAGDRVLVGGQRGVGLGGRVFDGRWRTSTTRERLPGRPRR